ncbi:hypothetical protein [Streptomyces sp. MS191]|uniref:hypothetical protein n=1 Tax=Streptomyces sp. ms191 TaxID=1827978 RepID=UPI0021C8E1E4|nr:hypothetical protein [Streptomyces sp. ms191]
MSDVTPDPEGSGTGPEDTGQVPGNTGQAPGNTGQVPGNTGQAPGNTDPGRDRPAPAATEAGRPEEPSGPGQDAAFEPAAPAPLGVVRVPTGHPRVDPLLDRLGDADHLAADGHLEVYEDVHRGLRDELTSLDAVRPGPGPAPDPHNHRS